MTAAWELTHSVDTDASPSFAWDYWTHIENWTDPPAKFELSGPFVAGARGTTLLPGQEPLDWFVREVTPPNAATIQMQLAGATLSFEWRFDGLAGGRTRLTQRVVLTGENANAYLLQVNTMFGESLPHGMNKLATAMTGAQSSREKKAGFNAKMSGI